MERIRQSVAVQLNDIEKEKKDKKAAKKEAKAAKKEKKPNYHWLQISTIQG